MARPTTITIPVSIGDIIYEKCRRVVHCRYIDDEYATDGQPNCGQHEYDCAAPSDGGEGCDAVYEYYVKEVEVNDLILCNFSDSVIRHTDEYVAQYCITKEEAESWIRSCNSKSTTHD